MEDVISLANVTVRSGDETILEQFNLAVSKGSLRILFGPSGAGKSTLFRLLMGGVRCASGTIRVGTSETASLSTPKFRRSIGVVFQNLPLLADRSVEGQILLPLEIIGIDRARRREALENILNRFQLQQVRKLYPTSLPMGMHQRVAIARAVASEPVILLADEPAAHLDRPAQEEIARILLRENLRGMTILIGTSDDHFASLFPPHLIQALPLSHRVTKN